MVGDKTTAEPGAGMGGPTLVMSEPREIVFSLISSKERNHWDDVHDPVAMLWTAAKMRRIQTRKYSERNIAFYSSGRLIGGFDRHVSTLASHQARQACSSRYMLRNYLQVSGLPVYEGKTFHVSQAQSAVEYQRQLGKPVTVRSMFSVTRSAHVGGLRSEDQLLKAWDRAAESTGSLPPAQRQLLVERHHAGLDLRVYAVGEESCAAIVRLPFYVMGDGRTSLLELVEKLLESQPQEPYLTFPSAEQVADFLKHSNADPSTVPAAKEVVPISEVSSAGAGGAITIDVTDDIHPGLKQLAVAAMWAFPGLSASGVDLRVTSTDEPEGAMVMNVDPAADIAEFRYPTYGQYRRVSLDIIRQMVRSTQR